VRTELLVHEQLSGEVLGLVRPDPRDRAAGAVALGRAAGGVPDVWCTGPVGDLVEGQRVTVTGRWQEHPRYGWSFAAVLYERLVDEPTATGHPPRWLGAVRWPPEVVAAVHDRLGDGVGAAVRADPYGLLAVDRVRFGHVDELARHLGVAPTDPRRVGGAAFAAVTATRREGHEHLTRDALVAATARLAGVDLLIAAEGVALAVADGRLAAERLGDLEVVSTPAGLRAERELAGALRRLLRAEAVSVLIGSRGSGLARATADLAGRDLTVIDVDAARCGDTASFGRELARVATGARVLVVGDPGLLPPPGTGQVLRDLVGSGLVDVTSLDDGHPQAPGGRIVALSREVRAGQVGVLRGADGEVFLAQEPPGGDLVGRVVRAVTQRIPEHLGVGLDGIQVLTPTIDAGLGAALGDSGGASLVRTVHDASGHRWPVVVLVADVRDRGVLDRRMLYTAVTRAEQALILVGQADQVRAAARWERPVERRTGLHARLLG
jgi:hypothetical protein